MATVAANRRGLSRRVERGNGRAVPDDSELQLRGRAFKILNRHPAVGLAVGVVRDEHLEVGDGCADQTRLVSTPLTG